MDASLDHLVVAGTDLSALVAWWSATTGEHPAAGGAHAGLGTRNALARLGPTSYVELIGPDEQQPDHNGQRPFGIDELEVNSIRLVTFALAVDDLDSAVAAVRSTGLDPGAINSMSRTRPDGVTLTWRLALPSMKGLGGAMPFLIEWGDGVDHPAASLQGNCSLEQLTITHRTPEPIRAALAAVGADIPVVESKSAGVSARLITPNGSLEL